MEKIQQFFKALNKLSEVPLPHQSDLARDGYIQRFEFTFDTAWKALQYVLREYFSTDVQVPNQAFRTAFRLKIISHEGVWIEMTKSRNLTSHTYIESVAHTVSDNIPKYIQYFNELRDRLEEYNS